MKITPAVQPRLPALDTLRAFAIVIVLMYHYKVVVSREPIFGFMSELGWSGVDLFFVLSGYLIGNQVLSALAKQQAFSLKHFYIRRLLRTAPNYLVVLALYCLFPVLLGGKSTASWWSFLSFTQNFDMRPGDTFTHSWSLCIEEQFYLIFPVLGLLIAYMRRSVLIGWSVLATSMLLAIWSRYYNFHAYGGSHISSADFYAHIYYSSFSRFDEFLPGIAIAMLKNFHQQRFDKFMLKSNYLLVAGGLAMAIIYYVFFNFFYQADIGLSWFITTFGYSLLAMSFGVITLAALAPDCWLQRLRIPGAASLALWSYAIYLIHKPLFHILKIQLTNFGIELNQFVGVSIIMLVSVVAGWCLFRFVETPLMLLRARLYPSNNKIALIASQVQASLVNTNAIK